jgi:hypothetical protein
LQKLDSLGIVHGHLTKDAFLIRRDIPAAQIHFFFSSYETTDRDVLDEELSSLEEVLQRRPLQKPVRDERPIDEITAFKERDGYIHPVLFWQVKHEGRISLLQHDHRVMLADLEKKNWRWTAQVVEDDVERLRKNGGSWS